MPADILLFWYPITSGLNILSPHTAGALTSWLLGYYFWESKLLWHREWVISTHKVGFTFFFFSIFGRYRHHSLDNGEMCVSLWKLMFQWIGHPKEGWTCEGVCPPIESGDWQYTVHQPPKLWVELSFYCIPWYCYNSLMHWLSLSLLSFSLPGLILPLISPSYFQNNNLQ